MEPFMKCKFNLFLPVCIQAGFSLLIAVIFISYNGYAQTKSQFPPREIQLHDSNFLHHRLNNNDSILKWKQSREFVYMNYLDSLLRKEKNLKSDTVHIDENNGKIKRSQPSKTNPEGLNNLLNSLPFKIFFWLLAIVFISYIFYKVLAKNGIFIKKKNQLFQPEEEGASHDLNEISQYDQLISEAENNHDLNLAIRYLFLKTLKTLSDKGLINFTAEKTNNEYVKEMIENTHYDEFQKLTHIYEYMWYGKFLIHKNDYQNLKEEFNSFNKNV